MAASIPSFPPIIKTKKPDVCPHCKKPLDEPKEDHLENEHLFWEKKFNDIDLLDVAAYGVAGAYLMSDD